MFVIHEGTRPVDIEDEFKTMLKVGKRFFALPLKEWMVMQIRLGIHDTDNLERLKEGFFNKAFKHGRFMEEENGEEIGKRVFSAPTWYRHRKTYLSDKSAPALRSPMVTAVLEAMEQSSTKDLEAFWIDLIGSNTVALRFGITDLMFAEQRDKQGVWERVVPSALVDGKLFMYPWLLNLYKDREYTDRRYCRTESSDAEREKVHAYARGICGESRTQALDRGQIVLDRPDQGIKFTHLLEVNF